MVCERVGVPDPVWIAVTDPDPVGVPELVGVELVEDPTEAVCVWVPDWVPDRDPVPERVWLLVPVPVEEGVPVGL